MEPLFIEQPKFEKVSSIILDQDPTKWTKQILDEFFSTFPFFMDQPVELEFKKKDEAKGYAVGVIRVGNLTVPVIVNTFKLAPFDVAYKDGTPIPLTEETIGSIFNSPSAFEKVVPPGDPTTDVDSLFQRPLIDLQPTSNIGKYASVIDRISDTITKEHQRELLEKLSDPKIQAGFVANNNVEILEKIAKVVPKDKAYFKETLSKVLPRDIHYLEKVSRFKYRLVEGNSKVYDPVIVELDASQAEEYEPIKAVGKDFEKKAKYSAARAAAFEVDGSDEKLVVMNVDGMRKFAYMKDAKVSDPEHCNKLFGGEMPRIHDFGVWVNGNKATRPFEIVGLTKTGGYLHIHTFDGMSNKMFIPLKSVDEITPHESQSNTYYLPASYKFVKVGEEVEIEKTGKYHEPKPANFFVKDDLGFYNLQGPVFEKYAEVGGTINSLTLGEASWAALQCGASKRAVEKLASAPCNVRIPFECTLEAPMSLEKVASTLEQEYKDYSKKIKSIAVDLVKEASVLSDPTSVDAILALNLITKENILEFVHQLPLYEQVLSDLAKLLLAVRLGLPSVPERAAQKSMHGLAKVVAILRGIAKLNKVK